MREDVLKEVLLTLKESLIQTPSQVYELSFKKVKSQLI
jgi:hypothetical protein